MISDVKERNYPKRQEICVLYHFLSNKIPKRCEKWGTEHDSSSESGRNHFFKLEIYKFTMGYIKGSLLVDF